MVVHDRTGYELARRCKCVERSLVQGIINNSGLPEDLKERSFGSFKTDADNRLAVDKAIKFYSKWPDEKGFIISGPVGTGKTHLMAAVMNNLIFRKQVAVNFVNTPDMMAALRDSQFKQGEQSQIISRLCDAPLLCFDDLGRDKMTDWVKDQYYRIINSRYTGRKPILATTNSTYDELAENLGDATASRLMAMCEIVNIDGKDRRR